MINIQLLELDDIVLSTDWCRPLSLVTMSGGHSDYYSFESCYGGTPENNTKWVRVSEVFGDFWFNKPVHALNKSTQVAYEYIRGDLPLYHQYGPTRNTKRICYENYLVMTIAKVGKHKGYNWQYIKNQFPEYYDWASHKGMVMTESDYFRQADENWYSECERSYRLSQSRR